MGQLPGLKLAWESGYRKVQLEIDSSLPIKWINNQNTPNLTCKIFREANKTADSLAKAVTKQERGIHVIDIAPMSLLQILQQDADSTPRMRIIGGG